MDAARRPSAQSRLQEALADTRRTRKIPKLHSPNTSGSTKTPFEYDQALTGVRLSFALSDWLKLAEAYPPAMAKLEAVRDDARRRVNERHGRRIVVQDFQELASINDRLGETDATVDAFRMLDERDPKAAKAPVYRLAQPSLIQAKQFTLCGKYLSLTPPSIAWLTATATCAGTKLSRRERPAVCPAKVH